MTDYIHVIGIDCAVDPRKVGIASGIYQAGRMQINDIILGTHERTVSETVFELCRPHRRNLIAIDAPLGWPQALGESLVSHTAGYGISTEDNKLFRRETDRYVKRVVGKQPLDVGADRIARTAYAALRILKEIGELAGFLLPLAWNSEEFAQISVIEVYPAATLESHQVSSKGYKELGIDPVKENIINSLKNHMILPENIGLIQSNSDVLDSAVCVLAAKDFLENKTYIPKDIDLAKKEGWIWVYSPNTIKEPSKSRKAGESSTTTGFVNKNNQKNLGKTNKQGSGNLQWFYQMQCLNCGNQYYANGHDIWLRKCPVCQGGQP